MSKQAQKVLFLDIETAPIKAFVWGLFDQNVALNQIHADWHLLSWAAKWQGEKEVMYQDQRAIKDKANDKKLTLSAWKLIDDADVIVTQNGKKFDIKKLNARFIEHSLPPPSSFRQIDTLQLAKKHFAFTSNKLEYLTETLNTKYTKQKHKRYPGFELWKECLNGNLKAWADMEKYNKYDVLALEELYNKLIPWDTSVRINSTACNCGTNNWDKAGRRYTNAGIYQRLKCRSCGAETRGEKLS